MLNPATWSLGTRVRALSAAVAVLLGLLAVTAVVAAADNRANHDHVSSRLTPSLINKERLSMELLRQRAALRTFALTGHDGDLAPYRQAIDTEHNLIAATRPLLASDPELDSQLTVIETALARYRSEAADPLITQVHAHGPEPALAAFDASDQEVYQDASDALGVLGDRLADRRAAALDEARRSSTVLLWMLVGAAGVIVATGFALAELLRRLVTRPVTDLAGDIRCIAEGDYEHEIAGSGVPELANLARDVDGMRRRIASDLAEVRTARRQAEAANRQLEAANQRLELQADELTRSNRDLEQFAYVASHDLQEPLRKVASFCQLLQRRYAGRLDERADQYITFAVDGAQRMQRLINDLLAFSRIGRMTSDTSDVDLGQLMTEVVGQLDSAREESGATITWDRLPVVHGEEALLLALFTNLVGNSLKFRRPGLAPWIHLTARRVGGDWEISCRDNGIGIAPEFADKVFVIFQRLHPKETYSGTGIGLAVVKKIVEHHGGRVWVDREYRDGTLIRLTIPASGARPDRKLVPARGPATTTVAEE